MPTNPEPANAPLGTLLQQGLELLPTLGLVLLLGTLGVLGSLLARRAVVWAVRQVGLETLAERAGVSRLLYALGIRRGLAHTAGAVVWFAGLLVTASAVAEVLGLPGVAEGLSTLVGFLPRLVSASVVLVGGLVGAQVLEGLTTRVAGQRDDVEQPVLVARAVYYGVVTVTVTLAAEQLGLQTQLVNALIQIVAAAGCFGLALAGALGSRATFGQLVARHYASRLFRPGDRVAVDGLSGELVRYGPLSAILRADEGELLVVPCEKLIHQSVRLERIG